MNRKLTHRENEIMKLVLQGLTNEEIAAKLVISKYTVKSHLSFIYLKTGAAGQKNPRKLIKELIPRTLIR